MFYFGGQCLTMQFRLALNLLCNTGEPGTRSCPASVFQLLGIQTCTTTSSRMQALCLPIWTPLFSPEVTASVHWAGWICHMSSKFCDPFCVIEMCCWWWLFLTSLWSGSHNSETLVSHLPLKTISPLCIKEDVCPLHPSCHTAVWTDVGLRACTLIWVTILITSYKVLVPGDLFLANQHFAMDDTVHKLAFWSDFFDLSTETRKAFHHSVHSVCA